MRPCFLFFSTDPTSKLSKAIRELGDGRVSHTGFLFYSYEFGQWMVLDAVESGFIIRSLHQFHLQGNVIVSLYSFPRLDLFSGILANKNLIGVPYDWNALVGRGVMKWWYALTGRAIKKNHWNDAARYYCNEIAAKVLKSAGVDVGDKVDMDPFQLEQLVVAHPQTVKVKPDAFKNAVV